MPPTTLNSEEPEKLGRKDTQSQDSDTSEKSQPTHPQG